MIKKIPVVRIVVGMYVHDLDCDWTDHPFLRNQFPIKNQAMIDEIVAAGIKEIYIDTARGCDVTDQRDIGAVPAETAAASSAPSAPIVVPPLTLDEEVARARKLQSEANKLVAGIMHDIRLGKQIEVDQCEPLVEGILDSIFSRPDALLPLMQVKTCDEYTFQHSVSVAALAVAFGRVLEMDRDAIKELAIGGLLHDVGKALVPQCILNKPGQLTDMEFATMKSHASHGADLLAKTKGVSRIAFEAASQHHERFDGTGYPLGLEGDDISLYGQMMAIVDVYDAITSLRIYHKGIPPTEALRNMLEWSKCHFNPRLVHAFIKGVGIYPAGSLVRLENGRLGVVREIVPDRLLQPVVNVFYDSEKRRYLTPQTVDLSASQERIVAHESFEKWGIDRAAWL